ncbi:MAG: hypothetical protein J6S57_00715, partial [Alphaproteobacteria bacterium]|nr:hypothetical protein [Alphaproteobacteria bacterium]
MLEPDNWMGYENREGFRDPIPEYVFFCEGVSEKQLVALLHKRFRNNVNLIAYAIPSPEQNDENKFFTPKRIADYCERILKYAQNGTVDNNGLYEYADYTADGVNNFGDNQQTVIQDLHQGIVTQICILVDTDVFFKTSFEHKHG